jgi:hypothetical protein
VPDIECTSEEVRVASSQRESRQHHTKNPINKTTKERTSQMTLNFLQISKAPLSNRLLKTLPKDLPESTTTGDIAATISGGPNDANTPYHFILLAEAHADYESMREFVNIVHSLDLPQHAHGCIIFLSDVFETPTPNLPVAEDGNTDLARKLISSQFYLRMFTSYGWATFTKTDNLEALVKRIEKHPNEYLQLSASSHQDWKKDIERIKKEISKRLDLGEWAYAPTGEPNTDRTNKQYGKRFAEIAENLLEAMAVVHQEGRIIAECIASAAMALGVC